MKHTGKLLVALILTLTLLISFLVVPISAAESAENDEISAQEENSTQEKADDAPSADAPATDAEAGAEGEKENNVTAHTIIIILAVLGIAVSFFGIFYRPRRKPWWMI